ncbi:hypothetical protein O1L55_29935 [Streptomyces albulus]|nr:hypothetical protein [Streptomyces noursei]
MLAQVADRETKLELGLIDSYDEYEFTWEYPGSAPQPHDGQPSTAASAPATPRHRSTPASAPIAGLPPGPPRTARALRPAF